ncbi:MAG: hypothetical protein Q9162_004225 [Coniocarpon cinnabarinum]
MSLQLLVVHNGQRRSVDPASSSSLETFKSWVAEATAIPAAKQILLNPSGKQARFNFLRTEDELFVYDRDVFSRSRDPTKAKPALVPDFDPSAHLAQPAPDALATQDDLNAWQDLFRARRKWALGLIGKARGLSEDGAQHFDAFSIIERGVGVAVGNLEAHVQSLEQRHNQVQDWATKVHDDQNSTLSQVENVRVDLERLPADARFRRLLPVLDNPQAALKDDDEKQATLGIFVPYGRLEDAAIEVRKGLEKLKDQTDQLVSQVDNVFQAAGDLFDAVEKTQAESISGLQRDATYLLQEIEAISNKVAQDCDHVSALPPGQKSVSQASKMALVHTRDYLPRIRDYYQEMSSLVQQTVSQRNAAATRVISNMQKVAEVEGLFAHADAQVRNIDFHTKDESAIDLVNLAVQLPFVYGALLLESTRRREWAQRIREESSTLAEDIARYREEEENRRRRWHKSIGRVVAEEASSTNVLNFELNLDQDQDPWPEVDRSILQDYIVALKRLETQSDTVKDIETGLVDLDKPTKLQAKAAKAAKAYNSSSFEDAHVANGSFFLRNNDEIKVLRDSNQKLEDEVKSQKSRVRKLEELLYRQGQAGRTTSGNVFQATEAAYRDLPTPESHSPTFEFEERLSRKASANSRRTSGTGTAEEKALAKRIVSLEADLHSQKQRNDDLDRKVQRHQQSISGTRDQLKDAESTKRDLMANLEAVQREFAGERRLLEEEIEKHRTRNEEVEEELDRLLGSRDADAGLEEKLRTLEGELEQTKATLLQREQEAKQHEEAQVEERSALENVHRTLSGSTEPLNLSSAELLHMLEDVADRANRQLQDMSNLVEAIRLEKDSLQTTLNHKDDDVSGMRQAIQNLEEEAAKLRNEKSTEQATVKSVNTELSDAREQLKALRAKFAEGETGSEVLQQRLTEQASRASDLATELAQAKSHVNSLDVELSSLQRRHNNAVNTSNKTQIMLDQRTGKARELTTRLITCYHDLVRLVSSLGLSMYRRDGVLVIQRPSKAINASTATIDTSVTGSQLAPPVPSFDTTIDPMLASWTQSGELDDENERFAELVAKLNNFNLTTFCEAVIKLRRDVEWTGKKWKMEARNYRDKFHRAQAEAHDKIAFRSFKEGDLALFLPTRNQATRPWAAFNVNAPHFFLREHDSHKLKSKEWLVARIAKIEARHVDLSKTMNSSLRGDHGSSAGKASESNVSMEDDNPFELSDGLRWYLLDAAEEKFGAPSTPSVGKSTVASATDHAKGSTIDMKKASAGNDASSKLQSLESRRSSSNSKRGSISGASINQKDTNEDNSQATRSPTLAERPDHASVKTPSIVERSSSRASHRNAPSRSSGLGIEIKEPAEPVTEDRGSESIDENPAKSQVAGSPSRNFLSIFGSPPKNWFVRGDATSPVRPQVQAQTQNVSSSTKSSPVKRPPGSEATSPLKARPAPSRTQSTGASTQTSPKKGRSNQWESLWALDVNIEEGAGTKKK